ncbi:hypothetical protein J4E93_010782 [Alternaria ventricosa]|uniref:uncharacterized protein n=1 Tax=Alternaria ventricosa TaxID=1187951 RepID=UPI0020C1F881|nr:uncharacterized protein J4E93_010782 [Alternaria ventricosa]KAI4636991.1 hypothetical protein J4E93_010782 [Alternaria ventricosa]
MDLPIEIRLMIYEFLVGEQIWPHSDPELHAHVEQSHEAAVAEFSAKSWTDGINTGVYPILFAKVQRKKRHFKRADRSVENETSPEDSHVGLGPTRDVQAAAMNLMRANREVRREVAKAVWGKSIKRFNRLRVLNDTVYYLRRYCTRQELPGHSFPPRDPLVLQRVSLSLSNEEYLHFVGYEFDHRRIVRRDAEGGLKMLAGIHTLQHLNLQFQIFEPSLQPLPGEGDYWEYRTDCWTPLDGLTCQKELVNIILTLGYDLLKRIEKVTISGHVKRSAHEKWDPLLRGEAYIKASGKKGDMAADVAEILATPDST